MNKYWDMQSVAEDAYECYEAFLNSLDEEHLNYEFCDRIGNETGDCDRLNREMKIEWLLDWYACSLVY